MVSRRDIINLTHVGFRKVKRFFKKTPVKRSMYLSYHVYKVVRIIRNPFIILEYVNVYNGLLLLGG